MAWYWQPTQEKMLRRVHEYSHLRIYPNDCGFAHCPGECGCRLSVVDGEPVVGEKYADLAYAAQANPSNRLAQSMRMLAQDVEIIDALRARVAELEAAVTSIGGAVRNAVADIAQMEVGPSQEKLLAALCNMVEMAWFPGCPGELEWPCPFGTGV